MIEAKVIAHSVAENGKEIVTFQLKYHRFIHGEVMTHRVFSRNAMSSRAVPVAKIIEQVRNDPATPIHWGANQPGMQAHAQLEGGDRDAALAMWLNAAKIAATNAEAMQKLGLHKQVANRILEPFQWMSTIVTATEWDNFYTLRCHPDAQPEFQAVANAMKDALCASTPVLRKTPVYVEGAETLTTPFRPTKDSWHLPYILDEEREVFDLATLPKISAARCARVSYLTHDGKEPKPTEDLALFNRLVGSAPLHASPIEHQAYAIPRGYPIRSNNFVGWEQYRRIYIDQIQGRPNARA